MCKNNSAATAVQHLALVRRGNLYRALFVGYCLRAETIGRTLLLDTRYT